jgi:large subunit ribosomal protein L10
VLHGQVVGMIAAPITGLVRGLNALIAGLAIQLRQIADEGMVPRDGGGSGAAPEQAAAGAEEAAPEQAPAGAEEAAPERASAGAEESAEAGEEETSAEGPSESTASSEEDEQKED